MTAEQWTYLVDHWGSDDQSVQEEIAKIKSDDNQVFTNLQKDLKERDDKIQSLTSQNIDLNKTNMNLILRLTDPSITPPDSGENQKEKRPPDLNDLDRFVTIT